MAKQLNFAVFVDYDNVAIGVKDTLDRSFDYSLVKNWLHRRGEILSQIAYGNWNAHGDFKSVSKSLSQLGVQMEHLQTSASGSKNGADIALSIDAMELVFTQEHINAYCILSGDSDFLPLVQKLKRYNKRVFVVAEASFASENLQGNCHEFVSYGELAGALGPEPGRGSRRGAKASRERQPPRGVRRRSAEERPSVESNPAGELTVDSALGVLLGALGAITGVGDRGLSRSELRAAVREANPDFEVSLYGMRSFRDLLQHARDKGYLEARDNRETGVRYFGTSLLAARLESPAGALAGGSHRVLASKSYDAAPSGSRRLRDEADHENR